MLAEANMAIPAIDRVLKLTKNDGSHNQELACPLGTRPLAANASLKGNEATHHLMRRGTPAIARERKCCAGAGKRATATSTGAWKNNVARSAIKL